MKTRAELEATLRNLKPTLRERFNVKEIGIFGSFARGDDSEQSDVDILVEFSEPMGWEFFDLKELLVEYLGREVDLVTIGGLRPQLKDKILQEVVYV